VSARPARLFLALDLPERIRRRLGGWAREHVQPRPELRAVPPRNLHVTLCFLGWRAEEDIESLAELAGACAGPVPDLSLGAAEWLPPRRPRVLAVDLRDAAGALDALQRDLVQTLAARAGYRPEKRPFHSHVTIARVRTGARVDAQDRASLPSLPPAEKFAGSALTLYRSRLARSGASYEPVARIALRPSSGRASGGPRRVLDGWVTPPG
jgi:RNA 2',3'-cyclic 3'-phosphodiesterase